MKKKLCAALLALAVVCPSLHAQKKVTETPEQKDKRMEWFYKAKLGIFIHWGVYAVKGVSESWSFYNKYLPHVEHDSLVSVCNCSQRKLVDYGLGFCYSNKTGLAFYADSLLKVSLDKIRISQNEFPPIFQIRLRYRLVIRGSGTFVYRKDKMDIRMYQFVELHTRRTSATSIRSLTVRATQITSIRYSQRQFPTSWKCCTI